MVSTFDLDMGVSFERSAFMGYLVHSAVTPALRTTPLWRVASDRRRGAERPGGALRDGVIRGSRGRWSQRCAGWTDPDRAPPACELYNSLGGLRNIPLSFSACCVTGNALLRPSERPPAPPWHSAHGQCRTSTTTIPIVCDSLTHQLDACRSPASSVAGPGPHRYIPEPACLAPLSWPSHRCSILSLTFPPCGQ